MTDIERFIRKVKISGRNDCWLWTGGLNQGYGYFRFEGRTEGAHRVSHKLFKGPIPKGMDTMHACDVRNCVNPNHLSVGTRKENVWDCVRKGRYLPTYLANIHKDKTHCPRNHPYNEANTIYYTTPKGEPTRECRECKKISRAKWLAKVRGNK